MTERRILAIDGGGIKGVLPVSFLSALEDSLDKPIVQYFDLIAGTSTGGIIALGLGLGLSAQTILDFYLEKGPRIFDSVEPYGRWHGIRKKLRQLFVSKYRPTGLQEALQEVFGDKKLGESCCRLVIPSYDIRRRTVNVFKTAHHERLKNDYKQLAVDVAMATAAAPTFFPAHQSNTSQLLIDGGVWANNPVGLAVVEAIGVLGWEKDSLKVLSLGCTDPVLSTVPDAGFLTLGQKVTALLMQGQASGSLGTAMILTGHSVDSPKVYRVNVTVPDGNYALDKVEQSKLLEGLGRGEARNFLPTFERIFKVEAAPFTPEYSN